MMMMMMTMTTQTVNLKGHEAIDGKTSVTVGAMADYTSKTAHTFAKLEHEVGEPGKLAIDVTGVELQKKFELFEGAMGATDVTLGVGVGWDGNPYINFDAMPSSAVFKAAGLATAIHSGRSIDLRPSKAVTPNIAIESPFSIYRDGMEVNLQFHGAIAAVSLPKSDFSIAKA